MTVPSAPEVADQVRAGLAEDERLANALGGGRVEAVDCLWETKYLNLVMPSGEVKHTAELSAELADHIARHDPARVLAEVAAKRALLDEVLGWRHDSSCTHHHGHGLSCDCGRDERVRGVLTLLAAPYQELDHV